MQNDPLGGERGAKNKVILSISFFIDPPFKRKKSHFFQKVVLFARRSATERNKITRRFEEKRNKIARRFEEKRNKIARSFGGERNKIARRYRRKGISWLGNVLVTE